MTGGPSPDQRGQTLRIQTVLYQHELAGISRLVESLARSVELARLAGVVGRTVLVVGDCGAGPSLTDADLADLRSAPWAQSLAAIDYRWFRENLGHGGGHNRLFQDADEELLLVVNPDGVAAPHLVEPLVRAVQQQAVGVAEARQLPFEHPKEWDATTGDTPWVAFACALVRSDVFTATGGFDSRTFFMHCDDVDLSWRVRLAGHRLVHEPAARFFHDKRMRADGSVRPGGQEERWAVLGHLLLAHKYGRPDAAERLLARLSSSNQHHQAALADYQRLRADAALPAPLPGGDRVATFTPAGFSEHRF